MDEGRRSAVAAVGIVLTAGCAGTGSGGTTPTRTAGTATQSPPPDGPPRCDPADVTRPAVATGGNIAGRPYPPKPAELTDQSVREFLGEFETAFAWNGVLTTAEGTVTSLNVDTLDGFVTDETGDGYLASSGMAVTYTTEADTTNEREYVANYFVAAGPVYRTESETTGVDPRERAEPALVQCGAESGAK